MARLASIMMVVLAMGTPLFGFELQLNETLYNPGDSIQATVKWSSGEGTGQAQLFATLRLPNGSRLYITPQGLRPQPAPYGSINLAKRGSINILDFQYRDGEWLPQGRYGVKAWISGPQGGQEAATAEFEVTSHYIPLLYPGKDPRTRSVQMARVEDGLWLVFADYQSSPHGRRRIYAMKVAENGRTLIPPFEAGETNANDCFKPDSTVMSVLPAEGGGFYLFTAPKDAYGHYKLRREEFDREGRKISIQDLKTYIGSNHPYYLAALSADEEGHSWVVAAYYQRLYLYIKDSHGFHEVPVTEKGGFSSSHRYKAFFDKATKESTIILFGTKETRLLRYDAAGRKELERVLPASVFDPKHFIVKAVGWPREVFPTGSGWMVLHPSGLHRPLSMIFLGRDGSVQKEVKVQGLAPSIYGDGVYSGALDGETVHMVWRAGSRDFMYAAFTLDGRLLVEPTSIFHRFHTSSRPLIAVLNGHPFLMFQDYGRHSPHELLGLFMGYDYPPGGPDLVLSTIHIHQRPSPYAALGQATKVVVDLFNRGEANSTAATLTLSYLGKDYMAQVAPMPPGGHRSVTFSVQEPPFLTQQPTLHLAAAAPSNPSDWPINSQITSQIYFPPMTPVFVHGASSYSWLVRDRASHDPIRGVHIFYTLKEVETVSGFKGDVRMEAVSDGAGHFQTVLPRGDYSFRLHRSGYPDTVVSFSTPPGSTVLEMEPPGGLELRFKDSVNGTGLHPAPIRTTALLEHRQDSHLPEWRKYRYEGWGDEAGLTMKELMPGPYSVRVTAFGYAPLSFQTSIIGSSTAHEELSLRPLPRGAVTGTIVSSGRGIKGATVRVVGTGVETQTTSGGNFRLDDLPLGNQYLLEVTKKGYQAKRLTFKVTGQETGLGSIAIKKIYSRRYSIPACRYAAWVQDATWSIAIDNTYEIKTIYGVWQWEGGVHYTKIQGENKIDIDQLDIHVTPFYWNYTDLDGHVVKKFLIWGLKVAGLVSQAARYAVDALKAKSWGKFQESVLTTYQQLSDPMGTVHGGVIDCGDPDALDLPQPSPSAPAKAVTVLRIDDVRIYDGDPVEANLVYSLHGQGWRQYYSDDYPGGELNIPIHLGHKIGANGWTLRVYLAVMNGDRSSGPLALVGSDHLLMEWKGEGSKMVLQGLLLDPPDYPRFEY